MEEIIVTIDGKEYKVKVEEADNGKLNVYCDNEVYEVEAKEPISKQLSEEIEKKESGSDGMRIVKAPLPGVVFSISVKAGEKVKKGKKLLTIMAMKMENEITSPAEGKVKSIKVSKNDSVNKGDILVILD